MSVERHTIWVLPAGVPVLFLADEVAKVLVERLGAGLGGPDVWQIAVD